MKKTFKYMDRGYITIETSSYRDNGTLALMMYRDDPDDYDVISVNLRNDMLQSENQCFIDTNNCPEAEHILQELGIGEHTGIYQPSGFWSYPLYRINLKSLKK